MNNFIELHDLSRRSHQKILINVNHITPVENYMGQAVICLSMLKPEEITVTESYEDVKQLLATVEHVYKEEE